MKVSEFKSVTSGNDKKIPQTLSLLVYKEREICSLKASLDKKLKKTCTIPFHLFFMSCIYNFKHDRYKAMIL